MDICDTTPEEGFELTFIEADDRDARDGIERLYMPGEALFGVTGYRMRERGWTVIPQSRDGVRLPAIVDGRVLRWGQYIETPPTLEETQRWSDQAAGYNTAIILGPVSGNTICLDIDVTDRDFAWDVEELADEVLGKTPFRRIGAAPKLALFYRFGRAEDLPRYTSHVLLPREGEAAGQMVEILSKGKLITSHGHHHRTGRYFEWVDKNPSQYGPEHATLITGEQLELFVTRLNDFRPIQGFGAEAAEPAQHTVIVDGEIRRPVLDLAHVTGILVVDGRVVDGRSNLLFAIARETVRVNGGLCLDDAGRDTLKQLAIEAYEDLAGYDSRRTAASVRSALHYTLNKLIAEVRNGTRKTWSPRSSTFAAKFEPTGDDTFSWIKGGRVTSVELSSSASASAITLVTDRTEISNRVAEHLNAGLDGFFDIVFGEEPSNDLWIVKAPTGAGKTTLTIKKLARDPRTYALDNVGDGEIPRRPIVFMLPSYANIAEVRARAEEFGVDPAASTKQIKAELKARGIIAEDEIEKHVAKIQKLLVGTGLRTMIYKGKVAAGCLLQDKVELLMGAGIGTSNLCHTTRKNDKDERVNEYCQFFAECPAIAQRKQIAENHVVFLPRSFLDLTIPTELSDVRAVIADESIWQLLTHATTMPLTTLVKGGRAGQSVSLSDRERESGMDSENMVRMRDLAAEVARAALLAGECPAAALYRHKDAAPKKTLTGAELVAAATRVAGSGITSAAGIFPSMSIVDLRTMVGTRAAAHIKAEYRFWKIVEERIEQLTHDNARLPGSLEPARARGDRDQRIMLADNGYGDGTVHLRWRSDPNWTTAPMLLLDASAEPEIIRRVFRGRQVIERTIESDFNARIILVPSRSVAVSQLFVGSGADLPAKATAAVDISRLRGMISRICAMHGDGRVAIGLAKKIRKLICHRWLPPHNADFMHYGATAGLDFASAHVAFIAIGRTELPTTAVDAATAALTYDDVQPELPIDPLGTGVDVDGKAIELARSTIEFQLRDGRTGKLGVQRHAGEIASLVQAQTREEQVLQFIGRARAVHREDTAAIYLIGQVVPDGLIVDEIATWNDLLVDAAYWDAVRRAELCIDADLLFKVSPEVATVEQYQKWIARLTLRELRAFNKLAEGIYVAGFVAEPTSHLENVYARNSVRKSAPIYGPSAIKRPAVAPRPEDAIEAGLGSRMVRRTIENQWRDCHIAVAIAGGFWPGPNETRDKDFPTSIKGGTGNEATLLLSLSAWQTFSSFDEPWLYDDSAVEIDEDEARYLAHLDEAA